MCNLKTLSLLKLGVMTLFCLVAISCTKDTIVNGYLPPLPIPDGVSVIYGDTLSYQLPEEYSADDISLEITVDHPGQQVDKDHSLLDLVKQSIKFDREHSRMFIYSGKLYPNNTFSSEFQNTIPENYRIIITSKTENGLKGFSKKINLVVNPAQLYLKNEPNATVVLTPYCLYNDPQNTFDLVVDNFNMEGAIFQFDPSYGNKDQHVNIVNNQIVVSDKAGDPNKKKEWVYTLRPILFKNGYKLAERDLKLSILPEPKLFYGIYYQDFDLTIIYNRFVIPLGNSFKSDAPVVNPGRFKGKFSIKAITLNDNGFNDSNSIFSIDETSGIIQVKKNSSVDEGTYKLIIESKSPEGVMLSTDFNLVMQILSDN